MLRRDAVFSGVFGKIEAKLIRKETSVSFFYSKNDIYDSTISKIQKWKLYCKDF